MLISKLIRPFIICIVTINLVFMGITAVPKSFSQDATDDEIKAALVFKFPVYVRWPDNVMNEKAAQFNLCTLGKGRLPVFLSHFDGEKIIGKVIRVKRIANIEALEDCHLLFISSSENKNLPVILKAIEGKPILTIGDMKGFAQNGGVINFIRVQDSVHFEINPEAGKRMGLTISSKLLRIAKIVKGN
ncbi:YfiR family protein [Desulfococcaceae bacterium HSG7]|nr:YfiR family protein [Desulfococcaceae bacterium HSG7]